MPTRPKNKPCYGTCKRRSEGMCPRCNSPMCRKHMEEVDGGLICRKCAGR